MQPTCNLSCGVLARLWPQSRFIADVLITCRGLWRGTIEVMDLETVNVVTLILIGDEGVSLHLRVQGVHFSHSLISPSGDPFVRASADAHSPRHFLRKAGMTGKSRPLNRLAQYVWQNEGSSEADRRTTSRQSRRYHRAETYGKGTACSLAAYPYFGQHDTLS
jgi:hypothetical protein